MKLIDLLQQAEDRLRRHNHSRPRQEALSLLTEITPWDRGTLLLHLQDSLSSQQEKLFEQALKRYLNKEPLSRIFGKRDFWKYTFYLSEATLDPRPDSETVIEAALRLPYYPRHILDLGTGSGCLLLSLLGEYPKAWGVGIDIAWAALQTAQKNAVALTMDQRCFFINTSWTQGLQGTFDLIVSNPPYITSQEMNSLDPVVKEYDPPLALEGGQDGLEAYRHIAAVVRPFLTDEGYIILEIGQHQEHAVRQIFLAQNLHFIKEVKDLAGIIRVLVFKKG